MHPVLLIHADEALRLANARIAGLHEEARRSRQRPARPSRPSGGLRAMVANLTATIRVVDVAPLPRLSEYPYRP
jgi:hypothetical protein